MRHDEHVSPHFSDPKLNPGWSIVARWSLGSAANLNVHFHSLVAQGVFTCGDARLVLLPAPSDHDVWRVLAWY